MIAFAKNGHLLAFHVVWFRNGFLDSKSFSGPRSLVLSLTARPWKVMVGRSDPFLLWPGLDTLEQKLSDFNFI